MAWQCIRCGVDVHGKGNPLDGLDERPLCYDCAEILADEARSKRCQWSESGRCEMGENVWAAVIHGNELGIDACEREVGPGFCYLDTK